MLAVAAAIPPLAMTKALAATRAVRIRLAPEHSLRRVPADFLGLGYEISSVATPGLLSATNRPYVQLVRNLGREGAIRVGGNTSDYASFTADGGALALPKGTIVNNENFRALKSFLDATGWKLIWGLDLGQDNLANAVDEARAIADAAGDKLLALEIGNEPDLFGRAHRSKPGWDYPDWLDEYRRYKTAIRAALPHVAFAGPDIAGNRIDWVSSFTRDEGGDLALLTAHHYIGNSALSSSTIPSMLAGDPAYAAAIRKLQAIAAAARLPYRICETNSFYGGGKAGVSDTFASALWVLDYLFVLLSAGCAGVNIETGVNHLGWISHYTPIGDDLAGHYGAAPEYYGMLAFALSGGGDQIDVTCDNGGINLNAYATRQGAHDMVVTVINKDESQNAAIDIACSAKFTQAQVVRLAAPSLSAMTGVSLAGAEVNPAGIWQPAPAEPAQIARGEARVTVPAGSAALISLKT